MDKIDNSIKSNINRASLRNIGNRLKFSKNLEDLIEKLNRLSLSSFDEILPASRMPKSKPSNVCVTSLSKITYYNPVVHESKNNVEPIEKTCISSLSKSKKLRGRSDSFNTSKKQKSEVVEEIRSRYCRCQNAPQNDGEAVNMLTMIKNNGRLKAFLIVHNEESLTLYTLDNGEMKPTKTLSVDYDRCIVRGRDGKCYEFENFNELEKSLGIFGVNAISSIEKEKAIMSAAGVQIETGKTALQTACFLIRNYLVKQLLAAGADVNVQDKSKNSLLHIAIEQGNKQLVEILIENGVSLNLKNAYGVAPLILAIHKGNIKIANLLVEKGANICEFNKDMKTTLHMTCELGFLELAKMILSKNNNTLNLKSKNGNTSLHLALSFGHEGVAKFLIQQGSDTSIINKYKETPLHIACKKGLIDVVKILIWQNANKEVVDKDGNTPLLIALKNGQLGCAKFLIDNGAALDAANLQEYTDEVTSLKMDDPKSTSIKAFMEEAVEIYKNHFFDFCKKTEQLINKELIIFEKSKFKAVFNKRKKEMIKNYEKKLKSIITAAKQEPKNTDALKAKVLLNFRVIYLKCLFEVQKKVIQPLCKEKESDRWLYFESTMNFVFKTYIDKQLALQQDQCNNSLVVLRKFLEVDQAKIYKEISVFVQMIKYKFPQNSVPKGTDKENLYLKKGVCYGAAIELAAKRVLNESEETSYKFLIYPSPMSRFLQAAHKMSVYLPSIVEKKINQSFKNNVSHPSNIDESFQKKLGINIESTEKTFKQPVINFIMNLEILISKLCAETSSHFILSMKTKENNRILHGKHAIYCRLFPPYEIQDVNVPGFDLLKTEDLQQFKMYLLFYFLEIAPYNYQEIHRIRQVLKLDVVLEPLKLLDVQKREFTVDDLPEAFDKMKHEEKEVYLKERYKISQEKNNLKKDLYLEILDEFVLTQVGKNEFLKNDFLDEYFKDKSINPLDKVNIKNVIKEIFYASLR